MSASLPSVLARSGGSPLAPKNSKRSRYNSVGIVFHPSGNGLPTPPDSEESISELPANSQSAPDDTGVNEHEHEHEQGDVNDITEDFITTPTAADQFGSVSSKRKSSFMASSGIRVVGQGEVIQKGRKIKWRFWKGLKS